MKKKQWMTKIDAALVSMAKSAASTNAVLTQQPMTGGVGGGGIGGNVGGGNVGGGNVGGGNVGGGNVGGGGIGGGQNNMQGNKRVAPNASFRTSSGAEYKVSLTLCFTFF